MKYSHPLVREGHYVPKCRHQTFMIFNLILTVLTYVTSPETYLLGVGNYKQEIYSLSPE